ncbi:MAG: hypothetical protein OK422_03230 [Thaumarchaeota archaeon]|nr:hypothetical protein [Nitrososphaerota archaeon]
MGQVCVATSDGRAYYFMASRLRRMGISFLSITPSEVELGTPDLILTTKKEADLFKGDILIVEDLDDNPVIMKGQLLAHLADKGNAELLLGIDPGARMGLAVFYDGAELTSQTFSSRSLLCETVYELVSRIPCSRSVVRIGDGEPRLSSWLALKIHENLPKTTVEIVDESGTSVRNPKYKGLPRDQSAAARIAFRRGKIRAAS